VIAETPLGMQMFLQVLQGFVGREPAQVIGLSFVVVMDNPPLKQVLLNHQKIFVSEVPDFLLNFVKKGHSFLPSIILIANSL